VKKGTAECELPSTSDGDRRYHPAANPGRRALLGWSQLQLADKPTTSLNALARLETAKVDPRLSTVKAIEKARANAGVEFLEADQKSEDVPLRRPMD
jgi:transcriptional regulator with XRE-family HTH domain